MARQRQRLEVFNIRKGKSTDGSERSYWTRCGVGFVNADGSINVRLELLPINGELHLRLPRPKEGDSPHAEEPL